MPEIPFFFPAWRTLPGVYVTFVLWKSIYPEGNVETSSSLLLTRQAAKFSSIWERSGGGRGGWGGEGLQAWPLLLLSRAGVSAALRHFTHARRRRARVTAVDDECNCDVHGNVNLKSFAVVQSQATASTLREPHRSHFSLIYSNVCIFSKNPNLADTVLIDLT